MKISIKKNPRSFKVGKNHNIVLQDVGKIHLSDNEQVTFISNNKKEYDVCRKEWGYYATPSMNDRLKRFGFKSALVRNYKDQIFLMLVENEKMSLFFEYLSEEDNSVIKWLDEPPLGSETISTVLASYVCPMCYSSGISIVKEFTQPPLDENHFGIDPYYRILKKCLSCHHIFNDHSHDFQSLYKKEYCDSVYDKDMKSKFEKIISLPPDLSDNHFRVERVFGLVEQYLSKANIKVLDIGSGLCVFLHKLKQKTGWECTALDPDPRQVAHAKAIEGIDAICASVFDCNFDKSYDLICLNKVLEHFLNPLDVLKKIKDQFKRKEKLYLYVEVPDGEKALQDSPNREEFFIEHYHAFSFLSLQNLFQKAGFCILCQSRIIEPSGKYTLYSFVEV